MIEQLAKIIQDQQRAIASLNDIARDQVKTTSLLSGVLLKSLN